MAEVSLYARARINGKQQYIKPGWQDRKNLKPLWGFVAGQATHCPLTTREYEEDALRKRLWSHAVGVINSKGVPTAHKGGKWLSEVPGSASAIKWGAHHAVLTAKHLVADLSASDLRLYTRPSCRPELAEKRGSLGHNNAAPQTGDLCC